MEWFRFYSEALKDRKIKRVAHMTETDKATVLGVWAGVLCLANESPIRGSLYLAVDVPFTVDDLAEEIGTKPETMTLLINAFAMLDMVALGEDDITVTHWGGRQFNSDNSTERVRQHRARKQDETLDETLPQRFGNAPETESDQIRDREYGRCASPARRERKDAIKKIQGRQKNESSGNHRFSWYDRPATT